MKNKAQDALVSFVYAVVALLSSVFLVPFLLLLIYPHFEAKWSLPPLGYWDMVLLRLVFGLATTNLRPKA